MSYELFDEDDLVIVRFSSEPTLEVFAQVLNDEQVHRFDKRVYDLSSGIDASAEDIRDLVKQSLAQPHQPTMLAAVATDSLAYGFSRMFDGYRQAGQALVAVFRDEQSALAWMRNPDIGGDNFSS